MLDVQNLTFKRGERTILNNVSLSLKRGDLVTLLGANGAGKSTLLNCMAGLLTPQAGEIRLNNANLARLSAKQIAQKIAYISQHSPQTYQYVVKDYVVLGRTAHLGMFNKPTEEDFALVTQAMQTLGIAHLAEQIYMQLSGGQKQLVNIAKVLVQQPELILFDEPTSALDFGNTFKVLELVKSLVQQNFAVVMTTHNPEHPILLEQALPNSRTALLTQQGELVVGNTTEVVTEANLNQLYQHANLKLFYLNSLNRQVCTIANLS